LSILSHAADERDRARITHRPAVYAADKFAKIREFRPRLVIGLRDAAEPTETERLEY
jgi:hypothetical protein